MGSGRSRPELLETPWRETEDNRKDLIENIKEIKSCQNDQKFLRIVVVGPCGSGKSSFINSVNNVFQGRITSIAPSDRIGGRSYTEKYRPFEIETGNSCFTVVLNDVMGLEDGSMQGCPREDIFSAIKGHIKPGYKFNPKKPLSSEDPYYIRNPSLSDKAYCLVYVLAADRIQFTAESVLGKMEVLRQDVKELELPQVIILTNVDEACPFVKTDLKNVYLSKKIKEKMEWCSYKLGVPMCHIFPVKNYSEEIKTNDVMDVLILQAFTQIIQVANDNVKVWSTKQ